MISHRLQLAIYSSLKSSGFPPLLGEIEGAGGVTNTSTDSSFHLKYTF